jgi:hypothetical protein
MPVSLFPRKFNSACAEKVAVFFSGENGKRFVPVIWPILIPFPSENRATTSSPGLSMAKPNMS